MQFMEQILAAWCELQTLRAVIQCIGKMLWQSGELTQLSKENIDAYKIHMVVNWNNTCDRVRKNKHMFKREKEIYLEVFKGKGLSQRDLSGLMII